MLHIRSATINDAALLHAMVRELAEFERELEHVTIGEKDLARDGFGGNPLFRALIADWEGQPAGYACFFRYYSTWAGRGLFLEDLFVRQAFRGFGIGKALLARVARIAVDEGCYGIHWEVLDWNQKAIEFYKNLGAQFRDQWRPVLLTDESLRQLAKKGTVKAKKEKSEEPVRRFATPAAWEAWLARNHRTARGLWLRLAKKGSGVRSVTYTEALEIALCYGWIDGQKRRESQQAWRQRFLPRSANSIWSKINREKVLALIAAKRMKPAGLDAMNAAKKNGTWQAAYDSPSSAKVPEDFSVALDVSPRARDFFQKLDGANRYAVLFRIQTVKRPETRARKIREFVAMLERGERIHEPRTVQGRSK